MGLLKVKFIKEWSWSPAQIWILLIVFTLKATESPAVGELQLIYSHPCWLAALFCSWAAALSKLCLPVFPVVRTAWWIVTNFVYY